MAPRAHAVFRGIAPTTLFAACFTVLSCFEVGGNVLALIAFNYWMRAFTYGSATVTVNFLCAFFYVIVFVPLAIAAAAKYVTTSRRGRSVALQRLRIFFRPRHVLNAFLIAIADSWIDIASTYAAGRTTVLTQVFAKSFEPVTTFLLTRLVLREVRNIAGKQRLLPFAGFFFVACGVTCHMYQRLSEHKSNDAATGFYIALYLSGVVGSSMYAITQSRFIRQATAAFEDADRADRALGDTADSAGSTSSGTRGSGGGAADASNGSVSPAGSTGNVTNNGDDDEEEDDGPEVPATLIRAMALAMDTTMTMVITLLVVPPLDTIPHFGSSASYAAVWENLHEGFRCIAECPGNLGYAVLTCGGWALVYFADTFMNHFSPTLNSMVNEFTSPVGVIVLFIHPAWAMWGAPDASARSIALDVASVVALMIGVVAFARYEAIGSPRLDVLLPPNVKWVPTVPPAGGEDDEAAPVVGVPLLNGDDDAASLATVEPNSPSPHP